MASTKINKKQIQDDLYGRPYHHLVGFDKFRTNDFYYSGLEYYGYSNFILDLINKIKWQSIADVGCGDGKICLELNKTFPKSTIHGYDLNKQAIAFAKAFGHSKDNLKFFDKDFMEANQKYDLILLIEVIEHIPLKNMKKFMAVIEDKLNDNGRLIISVPSGNVPVIPKHHRHYDLYDIHCDISPHFKVKKFWLVHDFKSIRYKFLRTLLSNRYFVLNYRPLLDWIAKYYKRNLLHSNIDEGGHWIVIAKKNG